MSSTFISHHQLQESLLRAHERYHFFAPPQQNATTPVVVAVSGGADSVALLHLLCDLRQEWKLELHIAHYDHATRVSSASDADFVRQLAQNLGLPFHTERAELVRNEIDNKRTSEPLAVSEATLRTLRYTFLCNIARKITPQGQTPTLFLAHHADDQAETILFRLIRGAGMSGMSGMQPVMDFFAPELQEYVRIVRPLLDMRRSEIIRYLGEMGIGWCEDPSNLSLDYARNRFRLKVLPELEALNPSAVEAIVRTAKLINEGARRLERLDRQQLETVRCGVADAERIVLDLQRLQALDQAEQRAILRLALLELLHDETAKQELSYEQVERLRQLLHSQHSASQSHPIVGDLVWSVVASKSEPTMQLSLHRSAVAPVRSNHPVLPADFVPLALTPETKLQIGDFQFHITALERQALSENWRQNPNPWQAFLDADTIGIPGLSHSQEGMRIAPLGMNGSTKSLGDFFTDCRIHPIERKSWPLLVDTQSGEILWVCGLAISHSVRLTDETDNVLWLRWEKIE